MNGYRYGDDPPTKPCPYCGTVCDADFVDIGVGMQQCGPYHCDACGASEIGAFDEERELTEAERACGWYAPGAPPGSSANVIAGRVVSHQQMKQTYRNAFLGNGLWADDAFVRDWWANVREPGA